jgi:hypothetical protein
MFESQREQVLDFLIGVSCARAFVLQCLLLGTNARECGVKGAERQ